MNILVSANDKYLLPAKVMLTSLLENNSFEHVNIYFLYNAMREENMRSIVEYVVRKYNATVFPVKIDVRDFQEFPISHHFSIETYYRFLAQEIIPETEDRVLWLDADMIIKASIREFYYQDFDGKYLVVCKSINPNPQELLKRLNCPEDAVYFNAGTILFNLELLRTVKLKDYHDYFQKNKDRITWLDQDILNGMYAKKTKIADFNRYNMQFFSHTSFSKETLEAIENQTAVLHFIGNIKPWHEQYNHVCKKYWDYYAKIAYTKHERVKYFASGIRKKIQAVLFRVRCFHGRIHEKKNRLKRTWCFWKYLSFPLGKKIYVFGTPTHTNIGDSAIVLSEIDFLKKCNIVSHKIKEVTVSEFVNSEKVVLRSLSKKTMIAWHGGGNMGNQWLEEEHFRRTVMKLLGTLPALIFPQTIYYTSDEQGQVEQQKSISVYNDKAHLTLVAREEQSYSMMQHLYPNTNLLLVPDMVLSANIDTFGAQSQSREGVLLCMRRDAERVITDEVQTSIEEIIFACNKLLRYTDMHASRPVTKENRAECVREKMEEFLSAELVVTDRLHGMIFAAITGTPCIVFSNYNHKVSGTYQWIKYLPYIRYAESVDDVEKYLPELLEMRDCKYDNTPLQSHFEKLAEVVRNHAHN